jgi:uncharacterized membrane protein YeaQ/YmgE (transglycosylase-associated protein family)
MWLWTVIVAIIVGLIIGALGRLVVPGKQPIPIWLTIVIGIVSALIGGLIVTAFGYRNANGGLPWVAWIVEVIVAAIFVSIVSRFYGRRLTR